MDPLAIVLRRIRRRLFYQIWLDFQIRGLFLSSALFCLWIVLTRFFPFLTGLRWIAPALFGIAIASAFIASLVRRPGTLQAALEADRRLGFRERLTSSWQLAAVEGPMIEALHADARRHLGALDMARDFPFRTPRSIRPLAISLLILFLAYGYLPEMDMLHYRQKQAEKKALQEKLLARVERLRFAAKPLAKPELDRSPALGKLAAQVDRVAMSLEKMK